MMNCRTNYPWQESVEAGLGYSWAYFDATLAPTEADLKKYFNLNKAQCKRFKRQGQKNDHETITNIHKA